MSDATIELRRYPERYQDLATKWWRAKMDNLDAHLVKLGITDPRLRREIIEEFFFELGCDLDGVAGGGSVPREDVPCSARVFFAEDETRPLRVIGPSGTFEFHDLVYQMTEEMFSESGPE